MPSFSYTVKEELAAAINDRDRKYACLYGMLVFGTLFSTERILIRTENESIYRMFSSLCTEISGEDCSIALTTSARRGGKTMYKLEICDSKVCRRLLSLYRVAESECTRLQFDIIDNNNLFAFLTGVFLICGSVTDPMKDYHLEFSVRHSALCMDLQALLKLVGIEAKCSERQGKQILYIKGSESIEDMLTMMGASMSSLEIMNVKILKDVRSKANRIANCDNANIDKTIKAAEKQISDIEYIIAKRGIDYLPDELQELALIRLESPDATLKELGSMLTKTIGRSGVNHRLMRIAAIADELREEEP